MLQTKFNMIPKDLTFGTDGRERLISGIEKISRAVKSTLGPLGKTVLIESPNHTRGMTITKDGVTVAKSIDLEDPVENLAIQMVKDAADRTAVSAGDGTTTNIILTEAIVKNGIKALEGVNSSTEVIRAINSITDGIIEDLDKRSIPVNGDMLRSVATVSCNNDADLGELISEVYTKAGADGHVTVENSQTDETFFDVTDGVKIDRGYTSKMFVNNQKNDECILDDVYILATDLEISSIMSIENILKPIIQKNKKLLIIGNCTTNVINTLSLNVVKNKLNMCNIIPPQFGYKTKELMSDIAVSVGAKYFSEATGDDLSLIQMSDLGHAKKVIVGADSSVIIKDDDMDTSAIDKRIQELREAQKIAAKVSDTEFIRERIASLTGGVGVIYVGGNSDVEQKEKYDRVEDAVCAVRSSIEEGVLPGGGVSLRDQVVRLGAMDVGGDTAIAVEILMNSLLEPTMQLYANGDLSPMLEFEDGIGINIKTMEEGNMIDMGIIDPAKVTKNALRNAVSIATTILSTNAIVTLKRADETNK